MKTETKFRALINNGWIYGGIIDWAGKPQIWEDGHNFIVDEPETIGQYTGYKINRQESYFGDLVSNNFGTNKEVIREIVEYEGNKMLKRLKGKSSFQKYIPLHQFYQLNYKIIGNIHQNAELLNTQN